MILLANKCDLPGVEVDKDKLDRFCEEHGFAAWFLTSAQNNTGVDDAMHHLVEQILVVAHDHKSVGSEDTISIGDVPPRERDVATKSSRPCCKN